MFLQVKSNGQRSRLQTLKSLASYRGLHPKRHSLPLLPISCSPGSTYSPSSVPYLLIATAFGALRRGSKQARTARRCKIGLASLWGFLLGGRAATSVLPGWLSWGEPLAYLQSCSRGCDALGGHLSIMNWGNGPGDRRKAYVNFAPSAKAQCVQLSLGERL